VSVESQFVQDGGSAAFIFYLIGLFERYFSRDGLNYFLFYYLFGDLFYDYSVLRVKSFHLNVFYFLFHLGPFHNPFNLLVLDNFLFKGDACLVSVENDLFIRVS
jgi:hypothetical protein